MAAKAYKILLIEDNPAQVRLTQEAFKEGKLLAELDVVYDGEEAIEYFRRIVSSAVYQNLDLIILDWNLPRKNGAEVLSEIRNYNELKTIPVLVFTSSQRDEDMAKAYELQASEYIKKPLHYEDFIRIVKEIEKSWLNVAKIPGLTSPKEEKLNK